MSMHAQVKQFSVWWDQPQVRALDRGAKLVARHCWDEAQKLGLGLVFLNVGGAAWTLGMETQEWEYLLEQVVGTMDWKWDAEAQVLWITDWWQWQPAVTSLRQLQRLLKGCRELPHTRLLAEYRDQPPPLKYDLQHFWDDWFPDAEPSTPLNETAPPCEPSAPFEPSPALDSGSPSPHNTDSTPTPVRSPSRAVHRPPLDYPPINSAIGAGLR